MWRWVMLAALIACGTEDTDDSGSESEMDSVGPGADVDVPTDADELLVWLQDGEYLEWAADPAPREGTRVHNNPVRSFANAELDASLQAGNTEHPIGSASVKELQAGPNPIGWAVMVKVAEGTGPRTWYWYEIIGGNEIADGRNEPLCSDCHESSSQDYFLSDWPPE